MQRALVTGASSGIGAALSKKLAARGLEVWLAARRVENCQATVAEIQAAGGKAHALALDVADVDATYARLAELDRETGGIDLVIANAGVGTAGKALSQETWAEAKNVMLVNYVGGVATFLPFIPRMIERGHGHLVGVSSIQADCAMPLAVTYGSAKAAFTFVMRCIDMELRQKGIAVTAVHPGFVRTPMSDKIEKRPFLVELDRAVDIIDRGIQRKKRMIRFPWVTGALARFTTQLPGFISRPMIRSATKIDDKTRGQLPPGK